MLTIERRVDAVPLGWALVKGGLPVLEITLRTRSAMAALMAGTRAAGLAFLPGVQTVLEAMVLAGQGYQLLKFSWVAPAAAVDARIGHGSSGRPPPRRSTNGPSVARGKVLQR